MSYMSEESSFEDDTMSSFSNSQALVQFSNYQRGDNELKDLSFYTKKRYSDAYISSFLKTKLPKFPPDLIIQVLSSFSAKQILIFQSVCPVNTIKMINLGRITKEKIDIKQSPDSKPNPKLDQLFDFIHDLNKVNQSNEIPVVFNFENDRGNPLSVVTRYIRDSTNFKLEFHFGLLSAKQFHYLLNFKLCNNVTTITILLLGDDYYNVLNDIYDSDDERSDDGKKYSIPAELNFEMFPNLQSFEIQHCEKWKLKFSNNLMNTLNILKCDDIYDENFILKLTKLRTISLTMTHRKVFMVKNLPPHLHALTLTKQDRQNCRALVDSVKDWPSKLRCLSLIAKEDKYTVAFEDIFKFLPPKLELLEVKGPMYKALTNLPASLVSLVFNGNLEDKSYVNEYEFVLPRSLSNLILFDVKFDKPIIWNDKLQVLNMMNCHFPGTINDINLSDMKKSLSLLTIRDFHSPIPTKSIDMSAFSQLKEIVFSKCGITSLENVKFPKSLVYLKIERNEIKSISSTCPLFNDPEALPNLQFLCINFCNITSFPFTTKLPVNLEHFSIQNFNSTNVLFKLNSSMINHGKLQSIAIQPVSNIHVFEQDLKYDQPHLCSIEVVFLGINESFAVTKAEINHFYARMETVLGKRLLEKYFDTKTNSFTLASYNSIIQS